MNDFELCEQIKAGDPYAFEAFVNKYQKVIFRYYDAYFQNYAVASDIAQGAFVKFYFNISKIKNKGACKSYLFNIARNLCKDELKKINKFKLVPPVADLNGNDETIENYIEPDNNSIDDMMIGIQEKKKLKHLIKELNQEQRAAITLVHFEEMKYKDAGILLGVSEGTVKSRVNRGLKKIAKQFKQLRS